MSKLLAVAIAAGCYTYAAPGSGLFVQSLLLPGLGLLALIYLLGLPGSLFVGVAALLWSQIDLYGQGLLASLIYPLLLLLWFWLGLYWAWKNGHLKGGDGGGDWGGGDGGGCGDGD